MAAINIQMDGYMSGNALIDLLEELSECAPMGYVLALHVGFHAPKMTFRTYPEAWSAEYAAQGFALQDPVVLWGLQNTGSARWNDIAPGHDIVLRAADHGLSYGVVHSIATGTSRSICSVARKDREFGPREIAKVASICDALHLHGDAVLTPDQMAQLHQANVVVTRAEPTFPTA